MIPTEVHTVDDVEVRRTRERLALNILIREVEYQTSAEQRKPLGTHVALPLGVHAQQFALSVSGQVRCIGPGGALDVLALGRAVHELDNQLGAPVLGGERQNAATTSATVASRGTGQHLRVDRFVAGLFVDVVPVDAVAHDCVLALAVGPELHRGLTAGLVPDGDLPHGAGCAGSGQMRNDSVSGD